MKILTLQEFRKLPEGTIFCKYRPMVFGNLQIFGGICGEEDFIAADLVGQIESESSEEAYDKIDECEKTGISVKLDTECFGRDAFYEEDQLFAVYEQEDILQLIEALKKGLH